MIEEKKVQSAQSTDGKCDESACKTCNSKTCKKKPIEKLKPHEGSNIKHVIAVVSGKGGVGKSSVTSMLAVELQRKGYKVGIMDADITGPSIPQIFGLNTVCESGKGKGIQPVVTESGIKVISINVLLEQADRPVIWRGPVITGVVKQFFSDVNWGDLDYLLIDMPPGTGDVPLTVFQSVPVEGIVLVSSPQTLVGMIVTKAVNLANRLNVPIIGIVENYSYIVCDDCGKKMPVFGISRIEEYAKEKNLQVLAKLPVDGNLAMAEDEGKIEAYTCAEMAAVTAAVEK